MAGTVYTFLPGGSSDSQAIVTSQGTVLLNQSGLFLPSEYQAAIVDGCKLVPGPAQSPASQLMAPTLAAGAAGNPNGTYKCAVTFVTAVGETKIGPEATITVTNQQISWSNIPLGNATAGVIARKLYRTAAGGASGTEKLVTTINDDSTTTFTDNIADGSLGAAIPTSDTSAVVGGTTPATQVQYATLTGNPADDTKYIGGGTGALGTPGSGGSGGSITVQGGVGTNLGATQTINFAGAVGETWLVGTLNANLAVTTSNFVAGCRAYLLLVQDGTGGRTLTVNGTSVQITATAGAMSMIEIKEPDGTNTFAAVVGGIGGSLLVANNLSDVANAGSSRFNLAVLMLTPAAAVATSNVASLSGLSAVDGYTPVAGDIILLTAQSTGSQNGPWVAASGAWTRPADFPSAGVVKARTIAAINGTVNAKTLWLLQTNSTITIDTTAQTWVQVGGGGSDTDYYQTLDVGGAAQTQRAALNVIAGPGFSAVNADNSGAGRSDLTLAPNYAYAMPGYASLLASNMPVWQVNSNTALATGYIYCCRIEVPVAITVANLVVWLDIVGTSLTAAQCLAGLYRGSSGALIGLSGDLSSGAGTSWAGPRGKTTIALTVQGGQNLTVGPNDYVVAAFLSNQTGTVPALGGWGLHDTGLGSTGAGGGAVLGPGGTASYAFRCNTSGQTSLPTTLGAMPGGTWGITELLFAGLS